MGRDCEQPLPGTDPSCLPLTSTQSCTRGLRPGTHPSLLWTPQADLAAMHPALLTSQPPPSISAQERYPSCPSASFPPQRLLHPLWSALRLWGPYFLELFSDIRKPGAAHMSPSKCQAPVQPKCLGQKEDCLRRSKNNNFFFLDRRNRQEARLPSFKFQLRQLHAV